MSVIHYVSRGQLVETPWRSNGQTLLQHLREDRRLCGTKEGCAEGDCGACTVVVGSLSSSGQDIEFRSVNSCIYPLSAMAGRLLVTVEELSDPDGALHPVQQAMVACHASQCGFCTPGFVMSLYDHYLHHRQPTSDHAIHERLAGNLCRCTGYAPILRAAKRMHDLPRVDRDTANDLEQLRQLDAEGVITALHATSGDVAMIPRSADQLAATYAAHPDALLLGGSTDAGLWFTKHKKSCGKVIHLGYAADLQDWHEDGAGIALGAAMRITDVAALLSERFPELKEFWSRFASPLVRSVATLGGNIANGSPIGDSMPVLIALGAQIVLRQAEQRRTLPLERLYLGYQKKDLRAGEFVEKVWIPRRQPETFVRAYKVSKRMDDDISAVSCALACVLKGGRIVSARIAYGGMAATPQRATAAEAVLPGLALNESNMSLAAARLVHDFTPLSDHRAGADYRAKVAGNLLVRAGIEFSATESTRVIDYSREAS